MQDAADAGEEMIRNALAAWPRRQLDIETLYAVIALVQLDLYRGAPRRAWGRIQSVWRKARLSGLLLVTFLQVIAEDSRARAALALAADPETTLQDSRRLLSIVKATARRLERLPAPYAKGMAYALYAGEAHVRKTPDLERQYLAEAERMLEKAEFMPWLSIIRLRMAQLSEGASAESFRESGMAWMQSQGVVRPDRLVRVLFPIAEAHLTAP